MLTAVRLAHLAGRDLEIAKWSQSWADQSEDLMVPGASDLAALLDLLLDSLLPDESRKVAWTLCGRLEPDLPEWDVAVSTAFLRFVEAGKDASLALKAISI